MNEALRKRAELLGRHKNHWRVRRGDVVWCTECELILPSYMPPSMTPEERGRRVHLVAKARREEILQRARSAWERAPRYTDRELMDVLLERWGKNCWCGQEYFYAPSHKTYRCIGRHEISPRVGTIYENSSYPLTKWYKARVMLFATSFEIRLDQLQQELDTRSNKTMIRVKRRIMNDGSRVLPL
jgi:hypothetical protein